MPGFKIFFKFIFLLPVQFYKPLIFTGLFSALDLGILLEAASRLEKTLSSPSCAQSYPQVLWIAQKVVMKPLVRSPFQESH